MGRSSGRRGEVSVDEVMLATVENWLQEQVGLAYDALKKDRSRAVSAGDVRAALAAEHEKATSKQ